MPSFGTKRTPFIEKATMCIAAGYLLSKWTIDLVVNVNNKIVDIICEGPSQVMMGGNLNARTLGQRRVKSHVDRVPKLIC